MKIIDWILYTSLFTACCAVGLCMATERLVGVTPVLISHLHLLVFGSTLVVYNAPRIMRKAFPDENNTRGVLRNFRFWYFVFFAAGVVMVLCTMLWLSGGMIAGCVVLGACAFAYSLPLLPLKGKKRLRDFGWIKILVLATVWTIATSVLPIIYHGSAVWGYPLEVLLRFAFIFTLCIIFDIRDMQTDLENNLYTLPNKMGIRNSYLLIDITLAVFVTLSIGQYIRYRAAGRLAGALATAIITRLVVGYLRRHPTNRAYMGLADGLMLVYSLLVLL